jgi:undecaprenyl-diphosphatase
MLLGLHDWDLSTLRSLYGGGTGGTLERLMVALTLLGSGWSLLGLIPLLTHRRTRRYAVDLLCVVLLGAILVSGLKDAFARVRPCVALTDIHALWDNPSDYSLPSGHATGSFIVAAFVAVTVHRSRMGLAASLAIGLFGCTLASAIALSRVYLGVHYPSDVIVGALLGLSIGMAGGARHNATRTTGPAKPISICRSGNEPPSG